MSKPLLFISHKHADAKIANTVAKFVRTISGGGVDVYLSSNPEFQGPRVGKALSQELRDALWHAGVVILVYTSEDADWSWCMWECGLADEPSSPDTKVVVLQCLRDRPKVFDTGVRALAWEEDSLINLSYRFLEAGFFPGVDGAVTGLSRPELKEAAQQLHRELLAVIPQQPSENWAAWPFLRFELPRDSIAPMNEAGLSETERLAKAEQALLDAARVTVCSSGLPRLFGRTEVPVGCPLGSLVAEWRERYPDWPSSWVGVLARQVLHGVNKKSPKIEEWVRFRRVDGNEEFIAGLGRIKGNPNALQFDAFFYGVGEVPRVTERMTRRDKMYFLDLDTRPAGEQLLQKLLVELEERNWSRVPVLDDGKARYIVHVSMIDRFVRRKAFEGAPVESLTLEDLLSEPSMSEMFSKTFAVVSERATLAEAKKVMRATANCEDAFVTATGGADEAVAGWLTDRDIAAAITAV